jgi:hypothetical protein
VPEHQVDALRSWSGAEAAQPELGGLHLVLDDLAASGCSVISLRESIDLSTPTGRLLVHLIIRAALAHDVVDESVPAARRVGDHQRGRGAGRGAAAPADAVDLVAGALGLLRPAGRVRRLSETSRASLMRGREGEMEPSGAHVYGGGYTDYVAAPAAKRPGCAADSLCHCTGESRAHRFMTLRVSSRGLFGLCAPLKGQDAHRAYVDRISGDIDNLLICCASSLGRIRQSGWAVTLMSSCCIETFGNRAQPEVRTEPATRG